MNFYFDLDLEGKGHILFPMVDNMGAHVENNTCMC